MQIQFIPLPTRQVRALQLGGPDFFGNLPEHHIAKQHWGPCRHCLQHHPPGWPYLIVAHRPFSRNNPYAEVGPIFLCADPCEAAAPSPTTPAILDSPSYLLRGYCANERIIYGSGAVVPTPQIQARATELLSDPAVEFVDIRSAANNCFQCRAVRRP